MSKAGRQRLAAFLFFVALSFIFLQQILGHWMTRIPGGLEDTRLFLWNLWWFHHAMQQGTNPFFTSALFHPFGVSLLSHDYPLWNDFLGYGVMRAGGSIPLAVNLTFLLTWTLSGYCVFELAREVLPEKNAWPAWVAGVYALTHSYGQARMMQNWGQFNFFGIALYLWLLLRAHRRERPIDWAFAGAALAFIGACHYYFLVYALAITTAFFIVEIWPWAYQLRRVREARPWRYGLLFGAVLMAGIACWISFANPGTLYLGGQAIGMETPTNAIFFGWIFLGLFGVSWVAVERQRRPKSPPWHSADFWKCATAFCVTAGVLLSPLAIASILATLHGDYPKQSILWKTHPPGANLFALFMPNPLQVLWGPTVTRWYITWGWQPQEQAACLGWVALAVVLMSRVWRDTIRALRWSLLAAAATILSMGVYLHLGSFNTWMPMPFYFWRLIPLFGNVRVPERWMAVGTIAGGVVLAQALVALARQKKISLSVLSMTIGALILFENWPGVPSVEPPADRPVYEQLRAEPAGGVLALPFFAGDSSIGTGDARPSAFYFPWDHLWAQTFHEKPIAGGYVGRVPRRLLRAYQNDPFFNQLIACEEGRECAESAPAFGEYAARSFQLRYVLVYPQATAPAALAFVQGSLPLEEIGHDADVILYRVKE